MITYTPKEERINTWSHAAGIALGVVVGIGFLVWCHRADDSWATTSVVLYLAGMLGSYIASTVYHALPQHWRAREVLRRFDHAAIYWHIAGTVMSFINLKEHSHIETVCYVLMGLSVLVAFKPLMDCVSPAAVVWLIAEGVMYITGAVFYAVGPRRPYAHSVFHFFVLAGSLCHIICVWDVFMQYL